jgi:diguanylate cyclase (GGDEF)-like protein
MQQTSSQEDLNPVAFVAGEQDKPLILLIDDDAVIRLRLRRFLEQEGYQVAEAENGIEGLAAYTCLHPDIVLLDALMPEMDGFGCCMHLQRLPGGARTPVLMITGLEDRESVDQAFAAGAADFVTKPIHWAVLRQRVRRLIHQTQLQRKLETANQALQRLISIDNLTQVANRRRFDEYLDQEWKRMARERSPLSLILCDVDFFKAYNDTYGHQAGDRCLQQIARVLENTPKRSTDLVARYGGEEFAMILPNTPVEGAVQLAELMRAAVRALAIPHAQSSLGQAVTLSMGVACTIAHLNIDFESLIADADAALYKAKALGRDRVVATGQICLDTGC